ncbi:MAG: F0F1 ATP synthase subunit gamma [Clostridia bacterium]|nr:F0F1 ATP synthase subunit gamma [Clostridia bacterium]
MGADIKKLRSRIKSVDSTLHLTKAMGLVASSKIRKATEAMNRSREYAGAIHDCLEMLTASSECAKSPYMQNRGAEKLCLLVVAGDRGLAGGYNANVFRLAKQYSHAHMIPIGKRACDRYTGALHLAETFTAADAMALAKELCTSFTEGKFDKIGIICTKYISMMSQEVQIDWILPLTKSEKTQKHSVIFEPDEATVLDAVIYEYIAARIIAAVRESFASEVAARRFAMDSAGKNAGQMLDDL